MFFWDLKLLGCFDGTSRLHFDERVSMKNYLSLASNFEIEGDNVRRKQRHIP
jgi:hypothetical protein